MGRNMALGVVGRGLRDVVILSVSALAAVWTLQHRDLVREALGIELPSVQIGSKGEGAADRKDRKPGFERSLSLRAGTNGHFNTRAEMNGRSVDVMVDTGASLVSLSYEDARSAGIYLNDADFKYRSSTANCFWLSLWKRSPMPGTASLEARASARTVAACAAFAER